MSKQLREMLSIATNAKLKMQSIQDNNKEQIETKNRFFIATPSDKGNKFFIVAP